MMHYVHGNRLRRSRSLIQLLAQGATLLFIASVATLLVRSGTIAIIPANLSHLFIADPTSSEHESATRQAGSSGPPPQGVVSAANTIVHGVTSTKIRTARCSIYGKPHQGLSSSSSPELRKLAQYEQFCGGAVAKRSSFFVATPSSVAQAQSSAQAVANLLQAYANVGMQPLVFMEPNDPNGNKLDLKQYAAGAYDTALNAYFSELKSSGITPSMLGMWVYLPEDNLPVWSTTDPAIFTSVVTRTVQLQKQYFPGSKASIMLDSESYAVGTTWGNGTYVSLLPYVKNLPKGLIDSFGLQGFPWAAPANKPSEGSLYDPGTYLRADFAIQAAQSLGIKDIWFNTGTFSRMYVGEAGATVFVTAAQRQQLLNGITAIGKVTRAKGYTVSIHLFAQNKAATSEATDWSYWSTKPGDTDATAVFTTFTSDAAQDGLTLWLYDTE